MRRFGSHAIVVGLAAAIDCGWFSYVVAQPTMSPNESYVDCGQLALYNFMRLENANLSFLSLRERLAQLAPGGYSLLELQDVARSFGVELRGVRVTAPSQLNGPALVFVVRKGHGHYYALRPIGRSGKKAQVLDGLVEPYVVDKNELTNSPEWTGFVLVRE